MDSFPCQLGPSHLSSFLVLKRQYELSQLRLRIFHFLVSQTKGGFSLKESSSSSSLSSSDTDMYSVRTIDPSLVSQLQSELSHLGWKTRLAYGNTTLFIYDPNHIPDEVRTLPDDVSTEWIDSN